MKQAYRIVPVSRTWQWIVEAFYIFRQQPLTWILLVLVFIVINVILGFIPILGTMISVLCAPLLTGGFLLSAQKCEQKYELELADLFLGFKHQSSSLITLACLYVAACLVVAVVLALILALTLGLSGLVGSANTLGGAPLSALSGSGMLLLGLCVFIGSMVVSAAYWFAPALVIFMQYTPTQAMATSLKACLSNWLVLLVFGMLILILGLIALIPLGLGLLIWLPVVYVSTYSAWKDIFAPSQILHSTREIK